MPRGLKRFYGSGDLHFITCSCYRRQAWLDTPRGRDLFLGLLEETRAKYRFIVLGYVIMPEHFHLLISEPQTGDPSMVLQVLKQRYAQRILRPRRQASQPGLFEGHPLHVWQARFYDFNVWTERKRIEKLRYMHRNPVKTRTGTRTGTVGLEQLPVVPARGERAGASQRDECHETASQDLGCIGGVNTRPLQKAQGAGHPRVE